MDINEVLASRKRKVGGYHPGFEWWELANSVQWPRVVVLGGKRYRLSKSVKRWRRANRYLSPHDMPRGSYITNDAETPQYSYLRYIEIRHDEAMDCVAPEAFPKHLRLSDGL